MSNEDLVGEVARLRARLRVHSVISWLALLAVGGLGVAIYLQVRTPPPELVEIDLDRDQQGRLLLYHFDDEIGYGLSIDGPAGEKAWREPEHSFIYSSRVMVMLDDGYTKLGESAEGPALEIARHEPGAELRLGFIGDEPALIFSDQDRRVSLTMSRLAQLVPVEVIPPSPPAEEDDRHH
jgi:hypothetical protein